jgi:capsid protein
MAPKGKSSALTSSMASTRKRERDQVNRRDVEKKTKRFMEEKVYGKMDLKVLETFRVDDDLFEEAVRKWYEAGNAKINPYEAERIALGVRRGRGCVRLRHCG